MDRPDSAASVFRHRPRTPAQALFRRIFLINGAVFTLGTLVLALSPATVSARVRLTEVPVLLIGLAVILAANALLLRTSLAPLDGLIASMDRVDPLRRSGRFDDRGNGDLARLIDTFNAMVDRLATERTAASASALAAQEGERRRIARELHDEIGQSLTVALLSMKRAADRSPADVAEVLHGAQETVRGCLDEVRNIARRLRPDVLDDLGLASALAALCGEFATTAGITVARKVDRDLPRLAEEVELVCYRIAQESLTNIARHAEATAVRLSLSAQDDTLVLRVRDNGRGGVVEDGAGIRGMRERALLVDATLVIDSVPGQGTEVCVTIPQHHSGGSS
ncbi:histidine kinase [Nocardia brasiliensis]|uniref:HAMP domain-containing sensor histidine kinase n=1 Tax=Nocardia brasiliensis TaxID=37326 RepID=UPI001894AE38|nr:histidine kinase [Nocardia brasiliensis]MBF6130090.1 HAMP domain-containing protein [Nocardia brasiliensis]MBF6542171.1 HAMP domain-containing protein [Nocardia brasiliensis]